MCTGFLVAAVLTWQYPDDMPGLGSLTSGVLALGINLVVYVVLAYAVPHPDDEQRRIAELVEAGRSRPEPTLSSLH